MTEGQLAFDDVQTSDDFDPEYGLSASEWGTCAKWALDHRRADAWIRREGERINRDEGRTISWRLDIDPHLAKHARAYDLDKGAYPGIDHNLSAPLARYYAVKYDLSFRLRARTGDRVKNATPKAGGAAA